MKKKPTKEEASRIFSFLERIRLCQWDDKHPENLVHKRYPKNVREITDNTLQEN